MSSTESLSFFLEDLPQPEVRVPRREKALITMGELGTLLGRGVSMSGTCKDTSQELYRDEGTPVQTCCNPIMVINEEQPKIP